MRYRTTPIHGLKLGYSLRSEYQSNEFVLNGITQITQVRTNSEEIQMDLTAGARSNRWITEVVSCLSIQNFLKLCTSRLELSISIQLTFQTYIIYINIILDFEDTTTNITLCTYTSALTFRLSVYQKVWNTPF